MVDKQFQEDFGRAPWVEIGGNLFVRAPQWQPIETAPKDGSNILATAGGPSMCTAHWSLLSEDWFSFLTGARVAPTHWMHLPAPPASVEARS